ncbi:MAG: alpha-N-acetylglucosaminidase, partial [Bacteroidota bacterium]|nr:alpha-N-acetylglucosaminidase [Bacteroidota bacterium]
EIETKNGKIIIGGNNYNSMAVGLNYYLKYYCLTSVSWSANDPIELPKVLPVINEKIHKEARCRNRFFLNYCTFGYTMPWWQWKDWERFIDWMALNGINMPLAITGQEAIWYKVWTKLGLTDQEIRHYFTGPAHLPWHRMSNLDYWGGPLPKSWLDNQLMLQKKIVSRERELNMTPVLPAFAGHVPAALKNKYPNAKISRLSEWGGFEDKYRSSFLDPFDPLFATIQKEFLQEQNRQFGTNHIYGTDPFNELIPPSWDTTYLANVSKTIYETIHQVDKNASWLQMAWLFYSDSNSWTKDRIKSFLCAVPQNKMILLDYFCENVEIWKRTDSFFNQPFIWCYLGNFGGNTMIAGNLAEVEKRMENSFSNAGRNMWGVGSTLEGFDVNPLMYEFVFEKVWSNGATNVDEWSKDWARRRCGKDDLNAVKAWQLLGSKIYVSPAKCTESTLTNARPALTGNGNWTTNNHIDYDNRELLEAWGLLLKHKGINRSTYKYDVVNIGRQVLGNYFTCLRDSFAKYYTEKNLPMMRQTSKQMLDLLDDLESLLNTQSSFLLGKWLDDAKRMSNNSEERNYYEQNARNIITTWGTKSQSLNDYGNRTWAGLVKGYYKVRWKMFMDDVIKAVEEHKSFDENAFNESVTSFEWNWVNQHEVYSNKPQGDPIVIANRLYEKYAPLIRVVNTK